MRCQKSIKMRCLKSIKMICQKSRKMEYQKSIKMRCQKYNKMRFQKCNTLHTNAVGADFLYKRMFAISTLTQAFVQLRSSSTSSTSTSSSICPLPFRQEELWQDSCWQQAKDAGLCQALVLKWWNTLTSLLLLLR